MYMQNKPLTWPRLPGIFCLLVGLSFFLLLAPPPLRAAEADPTIISITVDGKTMPTSNLSPISCNPASNMYHSFAAELSSDRITGASYHITVSVSPLAVSTMQAVNSNNTINLGTLPLQSQTLCTVTYTLTKQGNATPLQQFSIVLYTGGLDSIPPRVESVSPTPASHSWGINDNLLIYFSEEIDASTISNGTVILYDPNHIPVSCHSFRPQVSGGKTVLTIDPVDSLQYGALYTLSLNGLKDLAGNVMAPVPPYPFTTVADTDPLTIVYSNPELNAINVPLREPLVLIFNRSLDLSSINANTIYLTDSNGFRPPINLSNSNTNGRTVVTITPTVDLAYLSTYSIKIINSGLNSIRDLNGQTMASASRSFRTIPAGAPAVLNQSPVPYTSNVSVDVVPSIVFTQDMDRNTINSNSVYLQKEGSGRVPTTLQYSTANRTLTLIPFNRLEAGAKYYIYLTAALKSTTGPSIIPISWYFSTSITPTTVNSNSNIIERDPAANASGISVDKVIRFRFNTAIDSSSINTATVYLSQAGIVVPASVSYDSYNWVSIRPNYNLNNNTEYIVNVNGVKDSNGNYIAATSWPFYTGYLYANGSNERYPSVNASGVALDTVIRYHFSTEMNSSTINSSNISLTRGGTYVSINVAYDSATRWVNISPTSNLQAGTEYTINLSSNIRDSYGNYISGISWSFNTGNYYNGNNNDYYNGYYNDYYRAGVLSRDPTPYSSGIAVDKIIRVRFDKDMNSSTINSSNVYLSSAGLTIPARVTYDSSSRSLTIYPDSRLRPSTEYTVYLNSSIRDYNGNYFSGDSWKFTTAGTNSSSYNNVYANVPTGQAGQPQVILNGQTVSFTDVQPYIKNGRTFLPYRTLLEILGADISWDPNLRRVSASLNGSTIQLTIGQKKATCNNQAVLLDVAPEIKNGRTMIPLRFVTESLGFKTNWEASTNTVYLSS